jgi:hypothetical protein
VYIPALHSGERVTIDSCSTGPILPQLDRSTSAAILRTEGAISGAAFPYEKIVGVRIIRGAFKKYSYYFVDSKIAESFELDSA